MTQFLFMTQLLKGSVMVVYLIIEIKINIRREAMKDRIRQEK